MASDITLKPDFVFVQEEEWNTLISRFENGTEQRRSMWSSSRKRWRLKYYNRIKSDFEAIQTVFNNSKGAYSSLTWDNPDDGSTYFVRFEKDNLEFEEKAFQIYDFEFTLLQVK